MSHDTDKLIRQLSLVAFLMAERRPLTARDVKSDVEGYSEMSDEAFARRFYSDRSELVALGVPLHSQRDEFTGEELYTLRAEQYFLPEARPRRRGAGRAPDRLYLLDGQFAYAEPLRLALQNLALGRPTPARAAPESAAARRGARPRLLGRDVGPADEARGRDLQAAHGPVHVLVDLARPHARAHGQPVRPPARGRLLVRDRPRPRRGRRAHVPRLAHQRRHPLRHPPRARLPHAGLRPLRLPRPPALAVRRGQGRGRDRARPRHRLVGGAHGGARRRRGRRLRDPVLRGSTCSPAGCSARKGARGRSSPPELVDEVNDGLDARARAPRGRADEAAQAARRARRSSRSSDRPGPLAPERFGVLQALLAHLLARCGDEPRAIIPAQELVDRFHIPPDQLDEHLQLLNLVNFGGGCYAVYASLDGDDVRVDKELFGDAFRRAPRLTPLEARAIRLALEFVGPDDRRRGADAARARAQKARGDVRRVRPAGGGRGRGPEAASEEEQLIRTFSQAIRGQRLVEIEYVAVGEETSVRVIEPHALERELPWWYVHSWDRTRDAQRSFRLDRMRGAKLLKETFDPRPGLEPRKLRDVRVARVLFDPEVAQVADRARRAAARAGLRARGGAASAARTGSSARSSPTAASPRCSSRRTSAREVASAREEAQGRAGQEAGARLATPRRERTSRRSAGSPPGSPPGRRARTGS